MKIVYVKVICECFTFSVTEDTPLLDLATAVTQDKRLPGTSPATRNPFTLQCEVTGDRLGTKSQLHWDVTICQSVQISMLL